MDFKRMWRETMILGNPLEAWSVALGIVVVTMILIVVVRALLKRRLSRASETSTGFDDVLLGVVERTHVALLAFPLMEATFESLELHPRFATVLRVLAILGFMFQAGLWASAIAEFWLRRYKRQHGNDPAALTTLYAASFLLKIALWIVVGVLTLDNLGFDVTALVAGLGIGGIAIALATQNILGDLFASLSIIVDKPFVIGDFITIDDQAGTVERIGMKTTRIRSLSGEMLVFSNGDLLKSRIRNYRPMVERRVVLQFGVLYQTPRALLEQIPEVVRNIIESQEKCRFDRGHFIGFGDSSLNFEFVYFVLSPEYKVFADRRHVIGLEIISALAERGVDFAYPTRTIYTVGPDGAETAIDSGAENS